VFGNEVVTKHDLEISGRKNTAKLEDSFPLEFRTGDARGMDLQLSNKIYNSLKKYAYSEQRRYLWLSVFDCGVRLIFCRRDVSVICPIILLNLAVTVFTSLYFRSS